MKKLTNKSYKSYLKLYKKRKSNMAKKGYSMYDDEPLDFDSYIEKYHQTRKRLLEDKSSKNKTPNVNQYIVGEQQYEISAKQARAQLRAIRLKDPNFKMSFAQARMGAAREYIDWEAQNARRAELEAQGFNKAYIAHKISQEFWGS